MNAPRRALRRFATAALVPLLIAPWTIGVDAVQAQDAPPGLASLTTVNGAAAEERGLDILSRTAALEVRDVSLQRALRELETTAGIAVAYSPSLLRAERRTVTCECTELTVREAADRLLDGTGFEFRVLGDHLVIRQRAVSPPDLRPSVEVHPVQLALNAPSTRVSPTRMSVRRPERRVEAIRQGTITGTATDEASGEPLSAVQISVQGTNIGGITAADGGYTLQNVPAGERTITAQRLGYRQVQQTVTVTSGETATVNFALAQAVLQLEGVVATGLVDPTEGIRSPISVGRVDRTMMPVPVAGSAVQNLQGRLAGVTIARRSGQPGEDVNIQLRSQTSLTAAGRSVEPLVVVDGVILGTGTADLESMDIESIEVVRGAAAASLYGSRANAGVISITTTRGQGLDLDQTQFSARSEIGYSTRVRVPRTPRHHAFLVDDPANPTTYVDEDGNPVDRANRVLPNPFVAFMENPYPGPIYDNFAGVFQPDAFQTHNFSVMQNTAATNFAITLNRYDERGPLPNNDGYQRNAFRVNLDHRFLDALTLGMSGYHSRDQRDNTTGLSFSDLYRAPPDIDLTARDEDGNFARQPDPNADLINPLWIMSTRESERTRVRTLGSMNLRWAPVSWMSFMSSVSYDRREQMNQTYIPKGTQPTSVGGSEHDGSLSFSNRTDDTWNAEAQVQFRRDFGLLNVRTTFRSLFERYEREDVSASASDFLVVGVRSINAARSDDRNAGSSQQEVRALGYLSDLALNYDDRYIASILVRRDGSSLFGVENQWHNYYRTAFAWRIAQEDWFDVANVDELKLSYSRGTAGSRPGFAHQYELWSVGDAISKTTLGNRQLRPEHTLEQEVSLEAILFGRFGLEVNHAWQDTSDQLILLSLPSYTGYSNQWTNGGTLSGHTTELTLEASLIQSPSFVWRSTLVGDRTRGRLTEWPFPCTSPAWLQRCPGVDTGMIWGFQFATDVSQLTDPIHWPAGTGRPEEPHHGGGAADHADEFMVNDDGLLVWVGQGNHYTEGREKDLWGTSTVIGGVTYHWGMPFNLLDPEGGFVRTQIGNASHNNLGWLNDFSFGQLSLHSHLHAKIGGDGVNREMQLATGAHMAPDQDQAGKPDGLRKPMAYYTTLQQGASGSSFWVEDTSYLKLRTLALTYRLSDQQIQRFGFARMGLSRVQLGLIGRDLFTFTGYRGWDPEHAVNPTGQSQVDSSAYPPTRSFTAELSVTF